MQFTVLIEFLVPGLATTLLLLALLPGGIIPQAPAGIPTGDTATTLLLLAVSYPVGILVNFPAYRIQRRFLTPRIHRDLIEEYKKKNVDLLKLCVQQLGLQLAVFSTPLNRDDLREVFGLLRAFVFSKNIDRLNSHHLYQEGLQRLSRGMLVPLLLAVVWALTKHATGWVLLIVFLIFLLFTTSLALLKYSVRAEEELIARFFLVLTSARTDPKENSRPTPGLQRTETA